MADNFDPYQQWLGIDPDQHPIDHYRLLGLPKFESDATKIDQAADERMALVRSFQTGRRGQFTHRILNELSSAKLCLTNTATKTKYDAELRGQLAAEIDGANAILPQPYSLPWRNPVPSVEPPPVFAAYVEQVGTCPSMLATAVKALCLASPS